MKYDDRKNPLYLREDALHIFEVDGMQDYVPKEYYCGSTGYIQSFLDGLSSTIFRKTNIDYFENRIKMNYFKMNNTARDMVLIHNEYALVQRKIKWLIRHIWDNLKGEYVIPNSTNVFFSIDVKPKYFNENNITIEFHTLDEGFRCNVEYPLTLDEYREYTSSKYFTQINCDNKVKVYSVLLGGLCDKDFEPMYDEKYDIYGIGISGSISTYFSDEGYIEYSV